jgi:hypothetical protein
MILFLQQRLTKKLCHFSKAKTRVRRSFTQTDLIGIPEFRYVFPEFLIFKILITLK